MARRLVLLMALFSAVGFSFGWITEDLCCLGGSYADDPNTPVVAAEFALPAHSQAPPKAFLPLMVVRSEAIDLPQPGNLVPATKDFLPAVSSLQNPRRC